VDERSDTELLLASRAEPVAFVELYRRHAEDVLRYFVRRTLDPEAAAELTAETFAEAYASRRNYRDTGTNGVALRDRSASARPVLPNRNDRRRRSPADRALA
jgi:hypothetical protein